MCKWVASALCLTLLGGVEAQWASFGRMNRIEGDVHVLKLGSIDWEEAVSNLVIESGDIIKTGAHDFAEIELENGTLVRMDEVTELRVRYLEKDSENAEWIAGMDLLYGVVRVETPEMAGWDIDFDLEIPNGSVNIGEDVLAKIIVRRSGASKIIVYSGDVFVAGEWDELWLCSGEMVWISASGDVERPSRISTVQEGRFDRWCAEYRPVVCESKRYVDTHIYIGVHCLDTYGDWVWWGDCGWTWRPRVRRGWCPYRHGRWTWTVGFGWFWVSYEPWGWVPFHYGRWAFSPVYGWVWIPGCGWGPGWVAWSNGPGWVSWVPLGVDDRPVPRNDAHTAITSDCFVAGSRKNLKEDRYTEYVDIQVDEASWNTRQPGRMVEERIEARSGSDRVRDRQTDERVVREFSDGSLSGTNPPRKKIGRAIPRAADVSEGDHVPGRERDSARRREAYATQREQPVDRERTGPSVGRRIERAPESRSNENKPPESITRPQPRPRVEKKAMEKRPSSAGQPEKKSAPAKKPEPSAGANSRTAKRSRTGKTAPATRAQ